MFLFLDVGLFQAYYSKQNRYPSIVSYSLMLLLCCRIIFVISEHEAIIDPSLSLLLVKCFRNWGSTSLNHSPGWRPVLLHIISLPHHSQLSEAVSSITKIDCSRTFLFRLLWDHMAVAMTTVPLPPVKYRLRKYRTQSTYYSPYYAFTNGGFEFSSWSLNFPLKKKIFDVSFMLLFNDNTFRILITINPQASHKM